MSQQKSLSVYYSRKGNNYVSGSIVNLPVGNTEVIARKIQNLTGSDLFQIEKCSPNTTKIEAGILKPPSPGRQSYKNSDWI